jgi:hypothetical protein
MSNKILKPLVGIVIDDINIDFEITKEEVIRLLGEPTSDDFYYDDIDIRFEFDAQDLLCCIECGLFCEGVSIYGYDIDFWNTEPEDIVDLLSKYDNNMATGGTTSVYVYIFNDICVRLLTEYRDKSCFETGDEDDQEELEGKWVTNSLEMYTKDYFPF